MRTRRPSLAASAFKVGSEFAEAASAISLVVARQCLSLATCALWSGVVAVLALLAFTREKSLGLGGLAVALLAMGAAYDVNPFAIVIAKFFFVGVIALLARNVVGAEPWKPPLLAVLAAAVVLIR